MEESKQYNYAIDPMEGPTVRQKKGHLPFLFLVAVCALRKRPQLAGALPAWRLLLVIVLQPLDLVSLLEAALLVDDSPSVNCE